LKNCFLQIRESSCKNQLNLFIRLSYNCVNGEPIAEKVEVNFNIIIMSVILFSNGDKYEVKSSNQTKYLYFSDRDMEASKKSSCTEIDCSDSDMSFSRANRFLQGSSLQVEKLEVRRCKHCFSDYRETYDLRKNMNKQLDYYADGFCSNTCANKSNINHHRLFRYCSCGKKMPVTKENCSINYKCSDCIEKEKRAEFVRQAYVYHKK